MKRWLRVSLIVLAVVIYAVFTWTSWRQSAIVQPRGYTFDAANRKEWVQRAQAYLATFQPSDKTPRAKIFTRKNELSYFVNGEGLIEFGSGQWIYIISFSHHWDDVYGFSPIVGDSTMAVDHQGNVYYCKPPGCTGVGFDSASGAPFNSVAEFVESFALSDSNKLGWRLLTDENFDSIVAQNHQPPADGVDLRGTEIKCKVHGEYLGNFKVDLDPGPSADLEEEYIKARDSLFPNSPAGPFSVDDKSKTWAVIKICYTCTGVWNSWLKEQKHSR